MICIIKGKDAVNFHKSLRESNNMLISIDTVTTIRRDAKKLKSLFKDRK